DRYVVRDAVFRHQRTHEIEVGLRRRRKTDLDLLEADLDELFKKTQLALDAHRLDQRLVAVAQVGAHPDGRMSNAFAGPRAFGEVARKRNERTVFVGRLSNHGSTCFVAWYVLRPPERRNARLY